MKYHGAWFAAAIAGLIPAGALPAAAETIAVFTKSAGNPISRAVRAGAEAVAKANGVTVFHYIPTSADNVPQQTALVDEALSAKRDALVFTPVDVKAMVPSVQKVNAAKFRWSMSATGLPAAPPSRSSARTITASRSRPPARCSRRWAARATSWCSRGPTPYPRRPPGCAVSRTR